MSSKNFPLSHHISSEHGTLDQKCVWTPTTPHTQNQGSKITIHKNNQGFLKNH